MRRDKFRQASLVYATYAASFLTLYGLGVRPPGANASSAPIAGADPLFLVIALALVVLLPALVARNVKLSLTLLLGLSLASGVIFYLLSVAQGSATSPLSLTFALLTGATAYVLLRAVFDWPPN
jgi:hypothetical protein